MKWQPIETAPKDGTAVLLGWSDGDHIPCVGYWSDDRHAKKPRPFWNCDRARVWGLAHLRNCQPTYWMPLLDTPEDE